MYPNKYLYIMYLLLFKYLLPILMYLGNYLAFLKKLTYFAKLQIPWPANPIVMLLPEQFNLQYTLHDKSRIYIESSLDVIYYILFRYLNNTQKAKSLSWKKINIYTTKNFDKIAKYVLSPYQNSIAFCILFWACVKLWF